MNYQLLILFLCCLVFSDCSHTEEAVVIDFGSFSLTAPEKWRKIERPGTDSQVGSIALESEDTLTFDLGFYSNPLYEVDPFVIDSSNLGNMDTANRDISDWIIVKNRMAVDHDNYRYNNVRWDTIDSRRAKIVFPRTSGKGVTGVYIDSLWTLDGQQVRFNLYGRDLSVANEEKVLQVLKTLKFKQKK